MYHCAKGMCFPHERFWLVELSMHAYTILCTCVCVCIYIYVHVYTQTHVLVYIYIYIYIHILVQFGFGEFMHACMYVCRHTDVYAVNVHS